MSAEVAVEFAPMGEVVSAAAATLVIFAGDELQFGAAARNSLGSAVEMVRRAAGIARFKGMSGSSLDLVAPAGVRADRLIVIGTAPKKSAKPGAPTDYLMLGGAVMGKLGRDSAANVVFDLGEAQPGAGAADFMLGMKLRAYKFDLYKTKKKDDDEADRDVKILIGVEDVGATEREAVARRALAEGVVQARNLVNEPPNVLFPIAYADRVKLLEADGITVEILDEKAMADLGMRALLGVGQGSAHESRCVIMRWNGATDPAAKPIAFIGKGVCFDTGGISIKPASGMEDMKGDMAGSACVVGLMHALAARKAKVNVIGAVGLVENMPDGKAQRPGDIVKSMSGQTIEIINTDAEGRLVLADVLWLVQERYKPAFMIDLATLTGAIVVALGSDHAGLFSNNDELADRLLSVGLATGEKVWRMPLAPAYDKLIDSKFADVKNTGGRQAGSITAAQFLQRFTNDVPWAHLDIAATGLNSPSSDINQSWASGWGVRLLDRLVADHYEE